VGAHQTLVPTHGPREKGDLPLSSGFGFGPHVKFNRGSGRYSGEGARETVYSSTAYAKFSTRLVPQSESQKIAQARRKHIQLLPKMGIADFEVLRTGEPCVAGLQAPIISVAQSELQKGFGKRLSSSRRGVPSVVTQCRTPLKSPPVSHRLGLPDKCPRAESISALENYYGGINAIAHRYERPSPGL